VDGIELQQGDRVGALFPMHATTFELRLERTHFGDAGASYVPPYARVGPIKGFHQVKGDATTSAHAAASTKPSRMHHAERVASRREQSGKFEAARAAPVFQEVVWNEYCVLFPDGSSAPFNEQVRYTALTGYLRKKPVLCDGRAEVRTSPATPALAAPPIIAHARHSARHSARPQTNGFAMCTASAAACAQYALHHGESQRGWARHFCHLSMKQLA
jgi:hypothetical protein